MYQWDMLQQAKLLSMEGHADLEEKLSIHAGAVFCAAV